MHKLKISLIKFFKWKNESTFLDWIEVKRDGPEGAVLSQLLFKLYISDKQKKYLMNELWCNMQTNV